MKKEIQKIKIGERIRKDVGELESLKKSIQEIGLLHPIVIDEKNNLIAGVRRLKAYKELGHKEIPINIVNLKDIVRGEYDENVERKNFTPSEAVAIWEKIESKQGLRSDSERSEKRIIKATKIVGLSTDTLSKAKQVIKSNKKDLIDLMDETGNVNKAYYRMKQQDRPHISLPKGKYDVIFADPPWPYPTRYDEKNLYGNISYHYSAMTIQEICELKIQNLIGDTAVLFLWVATNFLEDSFKVIKSWGFQYKSHMVWIKEPPRKSNFGWYVSNQHEILLIATRGSYLPRIKKLPSSVVKAPLGKHSQKPEEFYEVIEKLYPKSKYLELFARNKRDGWTSFGNEI